MSLIGFQIKSWIFLLYSTYFNVILYYVLLRDTGNLMLPANAAHAIELVLYIKFYSRLSNTIWEINELSD